MSDAVSEALVELAVSFRTLHEQMNDDIIGQKMQQAIAKMLGEFEDDVIRKGVHEFCRSGVRLTKDSNPIELIRQSLVGVKGESTRAEREVWKPQPKGEVTPTQLKAYETFKKGVNWGVLRYVEIEPYPWDNQVKLTPCRLYKQRNRSQWVKRRMDALEEMLIQFDMGIVPLKLRSRIQKSDRSRWPMIAEGFLADHPSWSKAPLELRDNWKDFWKTEEERERMRIK